MSNLLSRPYHAFLSYSHKDRDTALKLHHWLTNVAGFDIWFDENHLEAGSPVAARLAEKMTASRNWILLASKNSIGSSWVTAERDQALHCAIDDPDFSLIALRIDDCQLGQAWPSLARFNWLETPGGVLSFTTAREIIDRLDGRVWSGRQIDLLDVFVSRGWKPVDNFFADSVCAGFCNRKWKLRLIGDSVDQRSFSVDRIREIMSSCSGHLVILPYRGTGGTPTEQDYKYMISELSVSSDLGIPAIVLAETDTPLPSSLSNNAIRLIRGEDYNETWLNEPPEWLEIFLKELKDPPTEQHVFLCAEHKSSIESVKRVREFIEAVTGLHCQIGRDYESKGLRGQIETGIASAKVVVANLGSLVRTESISPTLNLNTCVEAGIAIGANKVRVFFGKKPFTLFLTCQSPPDEIEKTSSLPFMFRDDQVTWYSNEAELLGHCRRLLLPYRKRIMNYEFARSF